MNNHQKFSLTSYKIWDQHKSKIEIAALNHYGNLLALLDNEKQLFIYDLMARKLLIKFDPFTLQSKNETPDSDEESLSIDGIQFSKNSSLLAIIARNNTIVYFVKISPSVAIDRIYNATTTNERIVLDPKNKYLFLECSENGLEMKYFKNPTYSLRVIEFFDETDEKNGVHLEFLHKHCDKKNKLAMVLRNKRMFLVKFSFVKKNQEIFEENVKILMNLDIKFLVSSIAKPIINRDCDKIVLVSSHKIEMAFQLVYDFERGGVNSIKMNKLKEIPTKAENEDMVNVFFYQFHSKFQIYDEFLLNVSIINNKQLVYRFFSLNTAIFSQVFTITTDAKLTPFKIMSIPCWDGSFLSFCHEKDRINFCLMVYELETPPSWVGLGFKFKNHDSNVEYQECEDEFDKKSPNLKKEAVVNLKENGSCRGMDLDVYAIMREESKKKERNKNLLGKLYKMMNVDI